MNRTRRNAARKRRNVNRVLGRIAILSGSRRVELVQEYRCSNCNAHGCRLWADKDKKLWCTLCGISCRVIHDDKTCGGKIGLPGGARTSVKWTKWWWSLPEFSPYVVRPGVS